MKRAIIVLIIVSLVSLSTCGKRFTKSRAPSGLIDKSISVSNSSNENLGKYPSSKNYDRIIVDPFGEMKSNISSTPSWLIDKNKPASKNKNENLGEYVSNINTDRLLVNSFEGKYLFDIYTNEDKFSNFQNEKNEFPIYEFISEEFIDNENATMKIPSEEYPNCFYTINHSLKSLKIRYYKIESKQEILLYENEFVKVNN
jgi:hypothetical protein